MALINGTGRGVSKPQNEMLCFNGGYLLRSSFAEDAPEAERFITGTGDDRFAIGRHGQIKHTIGMPRQLRHLSEARVFPDQNLILRVAVSAHLSNPISTFNAINQLELIQSHF